MTLEFFRYFLAALLLVAPLTGSEAMALCEAEINQHGCCREISKPPCENHSGTSPSSCPCFQPTDLAKEGAAVNMPTPAQILVNVVFAELLVVPSLVFKKECPLPTQLSYVAPPSYVLHCSYQI